MHGLAAFCGGSSVIFTADGDGGDLTTFQDVLEIGEWLHIGGKTSFGLGKYELTYQGDEK